MKALFWPSEPKSDFFDISSKKSSWTSKIDMAQYTNTKLFPSELEYIILNSCHFTPEMMRSELISDLLKIKSKQLPTKKQKLTFVKELVNQIDFMPIPKTALFKLLPLILGDSIDLSKFRIKTAKKPEEFQNLSNIAEKPAKIDQKLEKKSSKTEKTSLQPKTKYTLSSSKKTQKLNKIIKNGQKTTSSKSDKFLKKLRENPDIRHGKKLNMPTSSGTNKNAKTPTPNNTDIFSLKI